MKKIVLSSIVVLAMAFTSCGKSDSKSNEESAQAVDVKELVEKQNKGEELSQEEMQALINRADQLLPEFQEMFDAMKAQDFAKLEELYKNEKLKSLDEEMGSIFRLLESNSEKMSEETKAQLEKFEKKMAEVSGNEPMPIESESISADEIDLSEAGDFSEAVENAQAAADTHVSEALGL